MNLGRSFATAGRVLRQVSHDPRTVALLLVVPALLLGLIAWMFESTPVFGQVGPAMLGMFPFIMMFLITSITTLRERRSGTLERLLTTPMAKADFILGYTIAFSLLAALQAVIASSWAIWVCGLDVAGGAGALIVAAVVNGIMGTTLGLLASAFATTEFQVVQFMPALVFPQILLGGIFLPRDQMPDVLNAISNWLPLTYSIEALQHIAAESDPWPDALPNLAVVAAFAVASVALAALTLRRRTP